MSYVQLEEKVAQLGRQIEKIERRLDASDAAVSVRVPSFTDWTRLLGWVVAGSSLIVFFLSLWWDATPAWPLMAPILLGLWLALRDHALFDVSDSTLALLNEERSSRLTHARGVHKLHYPTQKKNALSPENIVQTLGVGVGVLMLSLLIAWAVLFLVPTASGQMLIIAAVLVALLAYSLYSGMNVVSLLVAAGLYLLLVSAQSPVVGLVLMAGLTAWVGSRAFRTRNWNLMILAVVATYLSLARWVFDAGMSLAPVGVEAIAAEMIVLAAVTFALPFASLRRSTAERVRVRWIIGLNTFGYTSLAIPVIRYLLPAHWTFYVVSLLFAGFALACLAWQTHGRASYAKYFLLSSLAGLLFSALIFIDPSLITLVWLMVSVILLTAGFVAQSYTFRLTGLAALMATLVRYLGVTLVAPGTASPLFFLRDRVWIGLLLTVFLAIAGFWYRDLRSRGAEEAYRLRLAAVLYAMAALVICSLFAVEAISLSY